MRAPWPCLPITLRRLLPSAPGVYVARPWFGHGPALYVGMSTDLCGRWCGRTPHHRLCQLPWHAALSYQVCPGWTAAELKRYEAWLIAHLRPALNGTPVERRERCAARAV